MGVQAIFSFTNESAICSGNFLGAYLPFFIKRLFQFFEILLLCKSP